MSKIDFNALKTILVRPGDITYSFINGREVSIITPIAAFIIANILYFAGPPDADYYTQMHNRPYSELAKEMVGKKVNEKIYVQHHWWVSRGTIVLEVFLFSFVLYFINYRKGLRYIDHLAASFEITALAIVFLLVGMAWLDIPILTIIVAFLLFYAFERMAYRWRPFRSIGNAALLVFLFYATLLVYRSAVFFITLLTL